MFLKDLHFFRFKNFGQIHAIVYVTNVLRSRFFEIKAEVYLLDRM